jgi:ABC-type nickel/cobalt efflux system permease component RcnA
MLGAILALVFTLAQGLFWAGIASTFVIRLGTAITLAARDPRTARSRCAAWRPAPRCW